MTPGPWAGPRVRVPEEVPRDFALGLVLAPVAGGKSSALAALREERGLGAAPSVPDDIAAEAAVVAHPRLGASPQEAVERLSSVGLGAVPTWCRPFAVLSHGEQCRVACALQLSDGALLDDFAAFIAMDQARGMAAGVGRFVRARKLRQVVVATVHPELLPWLAPDWVWYPDLLGGAPRVISSPSPGTRPQVSLRYLEEGEPDEAEPGITCGLVSLRCGVQMHPALKFVEEHFDYRPPGEQTIRVPTVPERYLAEGAPSFRLGVLWGPSGTGKTTALRRFATRWPGPGEVEPPPELLVALGLPPDTLDAAALSGGERHLHEVACAVARASSGLAVIDEFGSRLDAAARRNLCLAVRTELTQGSLVVATVHEDVARGLAADWILDTSAGLLLEGARHPRRGAGGHRDHACAGPAAELDVSRLSAATARQRWRRYSRHHYLSAELSPAAECYEASWGGSPVAFAAVLPRERRSSTDVREHRLVVLPDFQGLGIGLGLSELLAERALRSGMLGCAPPQRYFSNTAHWHLGRARERSSRWAATAFDRTQAARPADKRVLFKHVYVGSDAELSHGWAVTPADHSAPSQAPARAATRRSSDARKAGERGSERQRRELSVTSLGGTDVAFWATTPLGFEKPVLQEVEKKLPGVVAVEGAGRVEFRATGGQGAAELAAALQGLLTPERLYVQILAVTGLPSEDDGLASLRALAAVPGVADSLMAAARQALPAGRPEAGPPVLFRVTLHRSGARAFSKDAAAAALADGIAERMGWEPALQGFELEVAGWLRGDRLLLGAALSARGTCGGPSRRSVLSEVRPSLAYAMVASTFGKPPTAAQLLIDVMCGGNIVAEVASASEFGAYLFCISGDISAASVAAARENLASLPSGPRARMDLVRWDATRLPLRSCCAERLVVHPPNARFGPVAALYAGAVAEAQRVLTPRGRGQPAADAGRCVLLAEDRAPAMKAIRQSQPFCGHAGPGALRLEWCRMDELRLPLGGQDVTLFVLGSRVKLDR